MGVIIIIVSCVVVMVGIILLSIKQNKELEKLRAESRKLANEQNELELKYSKHETFLCDNCIYMFVEDGVEKCKAWERKRDDLIKGKWIDRPTCEECRGHDMVCGKRGYTFEGTGKHYVKPLYYWRSKMYYINL